MEPSVAFYWTCRSILSFTNKSQLTDWASGVHNAITADLGDATDGLPGDCGPNTSRRGACCSLFLQVNKDTALCNTCTVHTLTLRLTLARAIYQLSRDWLTSTSNDCDSQTPVHCNMEHPASWVRTIAMGPECCQGQLPAGKKLSNLDNSAPKVNHIIAFHRAMC
jgi:hypothetical protein